MQQLSLLHAPPSWFTSCFYTVIYAVLLWLIFEIAKILWPGSPTDSKVGVPPGNRGLPFIGETLQLLSAISSSKGVYDFVRIRRLRYGICFKTNIFGVTNVFISSTESAKVILNNEMGRFTKRYIKSMAEVVGDQSVLCAAQQQHKLIRSSLSNLFSASSMSLFIKQFDKLIIDELGSWEHKGTVIVQDEAVKITLRAMCKMLMSLEGEDEVETLQKDVALVCKAMIAFPLRLPGTRFHRGLQARERIMCTLDKMISERRRGLEAHHEDFLQHLLKEGDEAPSLSDAQIKDNILTIIIAGQDTTASAISWMVKYLDENPEVLNTLEISTMKIVLCNHPLIHAYMYVHLLLNNFPWQKNLHPSHSLQ